LGLLKVVAANSGCFPKAGADGLWSGLLKGGKSLAIEQQWLGLSKEMGLKGQYI
jgi:hypothetical protein